MPLGYPNEIQKGLVLVAMEMSNDTKNIWQIKILAGDKLKATKSFNVTENMLLEKFWKKSQGKDIISICRI